MLVALTTIASTSIPLATIIAFCAKDRETARNKSKSQKSSKSKRSSSSKAGKGGRSSKSSKSRKSSSRRRSSRSGKSGAKSARSGKSGKSRKSSKSRRSSSKTKLARNAERKNSKSEGSTKTATSARSESRKRREEANKMAAACAAALQAQAAAAATTQNKPPSVWDPQPEGTVSKSKVSAVVRDNKSAEKSVIDEVNAIKHTKTMSVLPAKLPFNQKDVVKTLAIKNESGERKAIKVKCSDNAAYRVNPVFTFAEPNTSINVDILRVGNEEKRDKLVILTATAANEQDAREVFNRGQLEREMMVVPLMAAN